MNPMKTNEHRVIDTLAGQRNAALDAAAVAAAQRDEALEQLAAAQAEIAKLQQRLHDMAADERGPSGATSPPDALRGD
jgi:hypothetical protein